MRARMMSHRTDPAETANFVLWSSGQSGRPTQAKDAKQSRRKPATAGGDHRRPAAGWGQAAGGGGGRRAAGRRFAGGERRRWRCSSCGQGCRQGCREGGGLTGWRVVPWSCGGLGAAGRGGRHVGHFVWFGKNVCVCLCVCAHMCGCVCVFVIVRICGCKTVHSAMCTAMLQDDSAAAWELTCVHSGNLLVS